MKEKKKIRICILNFRGLFKKGKFWPEWRSQIHSGDEKFWELSSLLEFKLGKYFVAWAFIKSSCDLKIFITWVVGIIEITSAPSSEGDYWMQRYY